MITRITGKLLDLDTDTNAVQLEAGALVYEVLVPGYCISDLSAYHNTNITLYCLEVYESSGSVGGNLTPLLIGFPAASEKAFFTRFIKVKGIGIRKALRALTRPLADIAYAIEDGDAKLLATLPEIGKRTAEQVIAELKGKLSDFAAAPTARPRQVSTPATDAQHEALEILLQLGERRSEAEELLDRAADTFADPPTTDQLVAAAYKLKAGSV